VRHKLQSALAEDRAMKRLESTPRITAALQAIPHHMLVTKGHI